MAVQLICYRDTEPFIMITFRGRLFRIKKEVCDSRAGSSLLLRSNRFLERLVIEAAQTFLLAIFFSF